MKRYVIVRSVAEFVVIVVIIIYAMGVSGRQQNNNVDEQIVDEQIVDEQIVDDSDMGWMLNEKYEHEYYAFLDDFENGLDTVWSYETPNEDAFDIVKDPIVSNNNVGIFVLYDDDRKVNLGLRSEIAMYTGGTEGEEEWYSWRFMLDKEHENNSTWEILGQWHQQPAPGRTWDNSEDYINSTPIISVVYHDGQIYLNATNKKYGIEGIRSKEYPINLGEWHDIKFHINWSEGSEGFVETWIDDIPVEFNVDGVDDEFTKLDGHRLYYPTLMNVSGNYIKVGTYRSKSDSSGQSIVYYDDIRVFRKKTD